jgi:hypothetical protein
MKCFDVQSIKLVEGMVKGRILILALLLAVGNSCSANHVPPDSITHTPPPGFPPNLTYTPETLEPGEEMAETQQTPLPSSETLSSIIASIVDRPDQYAGKEVEILGYYRGWNLLAEAKDGPPVTRSDWVIADSSGAIYVTGPGPQNLDPASMKDIWTVIRLEATVEHDQSGRAYLVAQKLEQVPSK